MEKLKHQRLNKKVQKSREEMGNNKNDGSSTIFKNQQQKYNHNTVKQGITLHFSNLNKQIQTDPKVVFAEILFITQFLTT